MWLLYCLRCCIGSVHCFCGLKILILNGSGLQIQTSGTQPNIRGVGMSYWHHVRVPTGTRPCITRYKRTRSSQCRDKTTNRPASRQGRDTKRIKPIHQKRDEKVGILLPRVPFWHSTLLLRIEKPYTQWVWIANPDQRYDTNIRWVGKSNWRHSCGCQGFFKHSVEIPTTTFVSHFLISQERVYHFL